MQLSAAAPHLPPPLRGIQKPPPVKENTVKYADLNLQSRKTAAGKNLKNSSAENLKSSMKNGYGTLYAKDSKIRSKPCPAAHCGIDPSDTEALSEAVGSLISASEQAPAEPASGENSSVQTESADRAPDKTENPEKTEIAAASEKSAVSGNTAAAEKNMQDGKTNIADTECKPDADMKKHFGYEAAKERFIRANAGKQCRTWLKQADEASGIYPGFNFHRELQNPRFCAILKNGIDVRTAYEVIHHDEIIPAALRCAVLDAEKKLSNKLMSNEARPAENGSGAGAGATLGTDVSKMSKANRDDIVRRVMRGEIIRL